MAKVTSVGDDLLKFDNGATLSSDHPQDCCEQHYLSFADLSLKDFEGLEFDLSTDAFFEKVEGYGIRLLPINGQPVSVPGYGYNNGYYSADLALVLDYTGASTRFDITECQDIKD